MACFDLGLCIGARSGEGPPDKAKNAVAGDCKAGEGIFTRQPFVLFV